MDLVPKSYIKFLCIGDVLTGQDGNKYIVCDEAGILYWKPHVTSVSNVVVAPTKPKKAKKYYWKNNDKKPRYEYDDCEKFFGMSKALMPDVSPDNYPAGYVWTTEFRNISYLVDFEYKGYSTTPSKFWNVTSSCPPCIDIKEYDYDFEDTYGDFYVDCDEQGNKFWCKACGRGEIEPVQYAYKFVEGTTVTFIDPFTSRRDSDGNAYWERDYY